MERAVWGLLAILITSAAVGVFVVRRNCEMNSIRFQALQHDLMYKNDELIAKLQRNVQQHRKDVPNTRQEFSEWYTEAEQATADIRLKQEQNFQALDSVAENLKNLQSELIKQREETNDKQNENEKRMEQLEHDHKQMRNTLLDIQLGTYRTCKEVPLNGSGKYKIRVNEKSDSFLAFCDQEQVGGGWMVIQRRSDGTQNFYRNWTDYRNGFGEIDGEHWLGLERIHQFTKEHDCELLVEMKDFNNAFKYARYNSFTVGSEAEHYNLKTLGEYSGTAFNSLARHKGLEFSTPDRDNDNAEFNCANAYQGGWWFKACYYAFLNGPYRNVDGRDEGKITWRDENDNWPGLQFSRMLIRPLDEKPTETSVNDSYEQSESSGYDYFY